MTAVRLLPAVLLLALASACAPPAPTVIPPVVPPIAPPAAPTATPLGTATPVLTTTPAAAALPTATVPAAAIATSPPTVAPPAATPTTAAAGTAAAAPTRLNAELPTPTMQEYDVPRGSRPHDVAPAVDGGVWYTAQGSGELGWLNPATGETRHIPLGAGSAPHGVVVGPNGAPWITDGGLNAIVRVDPATHEVKLYPLPADRARANLNTATFDGRGILWFTGQSGVYGRLDPTTGEVRVWDAPRGRGPYGIATTPDGEVYYASLAGSHIAQIDRETSAAVVIDPPTSNQGARRVWSDSRGRIWVSQFGAGQVGVYDRATGDWREWRLPGLRAQPYSVYVDERDHVWLSDFGANAMVRFDPVAERFDVLPLPSPNAAVRQMLGRPGEVWGAESGVDKLIVIRTA